MTFAGRLTLGALFVAWTPILAVGLFIRSVGHERLGEAEARRSAQEMDRVVDAVSLERDRMRSTLDGLTEALRDDDDLRLSLARSSGAERLLGDFARQALLSSGADVLSIVDENGRILGSGHFPADVGRTDARLPTALRSMDVLGLARLRLPSGAEQVWIASSLVRIGVTDLLVTVGRRYESVVTDPVGIAVELRTASVASTGGPSTTEEGAGSDATSLGSVQDLDTIAGARTLARVGYVDLADPSGTPAAMGVAELVAVPTDEAAAELFRTFDRALLFALLGSALVAVILARSMAHQLAKPVDRLASSARRVHLGKLDVRFRDDRGDELGRLGRYLNGMLDRIRDGVGRVRAAERRAAQGDLARQVNHDVRNGLVPIRNVLRHLGEAREQGAVELARVFDGRADTLHSSVTYLDELADTYRRVSESGRRGTCSVGEVVRTAVAAQPDGRVVLDLTADADAVAIDPLSLRRVVENLVDNALAASPGAARVSVMTSSTDTHVDLTVADRGVGIAEELQSKVFQPFWTSREDGTGLGLAIVRRLVADVGGTIDLKSREGQGTTVTVALPRTPAPVAPSLAGEVR